MKLIRVVSQDGNSSGTIVNVFSSDLVLKPNSTIGLAMASINLSDTNIDVDNDNNNFQIQLASPVLNVRNVLINNGIYNQTSLVTELDRAINTSLNITGQYDAGYQWKSTQNDGNLTISYRRSDEKFPSYDIVSSNVSINTSNNSVLRTKTTNTLYDVYGGTNKWFIQGCGKYQAEIIDNSGGDLDEVGLVVGILSNKMITSQTEYTLNDFTYAIGLGSGDYYINNNGSIQASGYSYVVGDILDINISLGKLNFCLVRSGGADINMESIDWAFNLKSGYYMGFSILKENTGFTNITSYTDPFQVDSTLGMTLYENAGLENNLHSYLLNATATNVSLILTNATKNLLGFGFLKQTIKYVKYDFQAINQILEATKAPSIIVELASINTLQSFDGKRGDRRSILCVIPMLDMENNDIVFQPSQILNIELNNAYEYKINQLVVRLLNHDDDQEIVLGDKGCSLSLVVS